MNNPPLCYWLPCKPAQIDGRCVLCLQPVDQCRSSSALDWYASIVQRNGRTRSQALAYATHIFYPRVISTWRAWIALDGTIHMQKPDYYVLNDHTLGYVFPKQPQWLGVLGADIHGYGNPLQGPVCLTVADKLRPATVADFKRFRVDPTGHQLPNNQSSNGSKS